MRVKRFITDEERGQLRRSDDNICGVLVHVRPDRVEKACAELRALPGVEVHQAAPDGRVVITVEDTAESGAGETMHRLYGVAGVVSAALVYHHHEGVSRGEVCA